MELAVCPTGPEVYFAIPFSLKLSKALCELMGNPGHSAVFPQLLGLGLRSASHRIMAPGAGPDWAGSGTRRRRIFQ